jgi:DNA polymerase delta subunit OB-fold domain
VKRSFDRQYAQLYFSRLQLLQSVMAERVAAEWPGVPGALLPLWMLLLLLLLRLLLLLMLMLCVTPADLHEFRSLFSPSGWTKNTQSNTSSPRTPLTTGSASVTKILGVGEDTTVAVIGTLYKDMSLKPSILDEYSKDPGVRAALGAADLCSDGDGLVLEDEGARMALRGSSAGVLEPHAFVTGGPVLGGVG